MWLLPLIVISVFSVIQTTIESDCSEFKIKTITDPLFVCIHMTPSRKGPIESHLGLEGPAKSATFLARDQKG